MEAVTRSVGLGRLVPTVDVFSFGFLLAPSFVFFLPRPLNFSFPCPIPLTFIFFPFYLFLGHLLPSLLFGLSDEFFVHGAL